MTHQEIQQQEIIERYVRHQLAPDERRAFQEHYFACEECFEQLQMTTRFIAGVCQAARKGLLADSTVETAPAWWTNLFSPALGWAVAAVLVLAAAFGWLLFKQTITPRQELAYEQPSPTPQPTPPLAPQPTTQMAPPLAATPAASLTPPTANPNNERPQPLKLEEQRDLLAQNRPPEEAPDKPPVVLLESSRDANASSNQLMLTANARRAILRIEVEPGSSFSSFQCQVFDRARRLLTTATSGKASARGTVAVSIAADQLQNGKHLVKCYGVRDAQRELIGEYDLQVRRP